MSDSASAGGLFLRDDPQRGYYADLSEFMTARARTPSEALAALERMTADRDAANPVSIAQLGLGSWQWRAAEPGWDEVVTRVADWIVATMDERGLIAYHFPMPHTYRLRPPWFSAMAQGEMASLLVRASATCSEPAYAGAARLAATSLVDRDLGLVATTPEGPVLQEYPTDPPADVLNGWIFALWGLHDAAATDPKDTLLRDSFEAGVDALAARLPRYSTLWHWSRYDLFPHPLPNVASPFYHRLHVEQLRAMEQLAPREAFRAIRSTWELGAASRLTRGLGFGRKVAFRIVRPRRKLRS